MDEIFFKEYETANGFEFDQKEKELMAKQNYECDTCGNSFKEHNEDFYIVDDRCVDGADAMLCRNCYEDDYQCHCVICEEMDDNPTLENHHIYVSKALSEETDLKAGIYKVKSYPFFFGSILSGFDDFFNGALELVKEIDIAKVDNYINKYKHYEKYEYNGGNICECCVSTYTKIQGLYHKNSYLNEVFKNQNGLHLNITMKGIIKDGLRI